MTNRERVLSVYPTAWALQILGGRWTIRRNFVSAERATIGEGISPSQAWADAWRNIKKDVEG